MSLDPGRDGKETSVLADEAGDTSRLGSWGGRAVIPGALPLFLGALFGGFLLARNESGCRLRARGGMPWENDARGGNEAGLRG